MIYKTLYGNPLDFSKIYDNVMNDEIKLTYLLFSVYLSVLCSLGPFGAILSDLSSLFFLTGGTKPTINRSKSLQMALNYTEQTSSATVNTNCKLGLPDILLE